MEVSVKSSITQAPKDDSPGSGKTNSSTGDTVQMLITSSNSDYMSNGTPISLNSTPSNPSDQSCSTNESGGSIILKDSSNTGKKPMMKSKKKLELPGPTPMKMKVDSIE